MKSFLKKVVVTLILAAAVIVGGAYILLPQAKVECALVINVPPEKVYAIVANLKRFNDWSPWFATDPKATYILEGPDAGGVGQKMSWDSSDPKMGKGSQTVTEAVANQKIVMALDMDKMGKSVSVLSLAPVANGTVVIWSFETPLSGIKERWSGLMFDNWIGGDTRRASPTSRRWPKRKPRKADRSLASGS